MSFISTRNLYIVNTPLQLTTAYIIAYNYFKNDENILFISMPKQYARWHNEPLIKFLLNQNTIWSDSYSFTRQDAEEKSVLEVIRFFNGLKSKINTNGEVFLGNDKHIVNQILVELSGNNTYNRFDEGLGSYTLNNEKRKLSSRVGEYLLVKVAQLILRCNTGLQYNFGGLGSGQGAKKDYLYKPELLKRYSPQVVEITRDKIQAALSNTSESISQKEEIHENKYIVYLGSSYSGFKSDINNIIACELGILQQIGQWANSIGCKVLYKPHPGEKTDKIDLYKKNISNIVFYDSIEPVELICNKNHEIRYMISLFSSGMLHLDKFSATKIKTISIVNILENEIGKVLVNDDKKDIMCICNVVSPANMDNLKSLLY